MTISTYNFKYDTKYWEDEGKYWKVSKNGDTWDVSPVSASELQNDPPDTRFPEITKPTSSMKKNELLLVAKDLYYTLVNITYDRDTKDEEINRLEDLYEKNIDEISKLKDNIKGLTEIPYLVGGIAGIIHKIRGIIEDPKPLDMRSNPTQTLEYHLDEMQSIIDQITKKLGV